MSCNNIKEYLACEKWKIVPSPPDGHCLLHSIVSSTFDQLPSATHYSHLELINILEQEVLHNHEVYFMLGFTEESLLSQLNDYLYKMLFVSDLVDIVPFALNLNIRVLDTNALGLFIESVFSPIEPTLDTIAIH